MARSKSSNRWLQEHVTDPYVKLAQQAGYRSRAVYKLLELQEKYNIIRKGMIIVDLGAAPGGWSQYVAEILNKNGRIIALDLLPIDPIPNVELLQGDFQEEVILEKLLNMVGECKVDLVLSDMAPNTSGIDSVDQPKSIYLAELALELAEKSLRPGGSLVIKVFQGQGIDEYIKSVKQLFTQVLQKKPSASRSRSKEFYLLARNFKR